MANEVTHFMVGGQTNTGKSYFQANLAVSAASTCYTLVVDSNKTYRHITAMHQRHRFVRLEDLKINPWDDSDGVSAGQVDQILHHELCRAYRLEFAEYELGEVVAGMRARGEVPNLTSVIRRLEVQTYKGWSNRARYRDSALLILGNLLRATGELFRCRQGMELRRLIEGNTVIEMSGLPEHQAMIVRLLFERIHLLVLSGWKPAKPLLFILDEGQVIAGQRDFSAKMLTLRHRGVHLSTNFQNLSAAPLEMLGNADVLICFQSVDARDRQAFAKAAKLATPGQVDALATLKIGECVAFLPRCGRGWGQPFRAKVPWLDVRQVSDAEVKELSRRTVEGLDWEPLHEDAGDGHGGERGEGKRSSSGHKGVRADAHGGAGVVGGGWRDGDRSKFDQQAEAMLRDVLNQAHEESPLTARFERAGVRSASRQGQLIRFLIAEGYIKVWPLAVNARGRPWKLVEPTTKAFAEFGVSWKKGRGSLVVRVSTSMMRRKMSQLPGWNCQAEGILRVEGEEKQVDLLCRDPKNEIVAIEIAGSAGHEIHNALFCLRSSEVRKHAVVCVDKKTLEAVQKKFADVPLLVMDSRVETLTLNMALEKDWVP